MSSVLHTLSSEIPAFPVNSITLTPCPARTLLKFLCCALFFILERVLASLPWLQLQLYNYMSKTDVASVALYSLHLWSMKYCQLFSEQGMFWYLSVLAGNTVFKLDLQDDG